MKRSLALLFIVIHLAFPATARAYAELSAFYSSDSLSAGTSTGSTQSFFDGSIGFGIDSKKSYLVGWNYSRYSVATASSPAQSYSSTQMGPRFLWRFGHDQTWNLGVGYNVITKATYDSGSGGAVDWKGSAFKFDVGYAFPVSDAFTIAIRLNYSTASYNEQLTSSNAYSTISYSRSHLFPSLAVLWLW